MKFLHFLRSLFSKESPVVVAPEPVVVEKAPAPKKKVVKKKK